MPSRVYPLPTIEIASIDSVSEPRSVALFTSAPAFNALGGQLDLNIVWECEPVDALLGTFESFARDIPDSVEVIYSVGGGLPIDAAKLAAFRRGLPHISIPTALSVDAPLTPASGYRKDGCVFYIDTAAPEKLIMDWDIIAAAPPFVRAAGICDVLSIATGLWDWRFAEDEGKNDEDQRWIDYAAAVAQSLLDEAIAIAESAGNGETTGLTRLLELLGLEVQLCNFIGHSRPEEGCEHAFAYSVENLVGKGLPHGDLVGPGILAMAAAQDQQIESLREALLASGARLDRIPAEDALATLEELPEYVRTHRLPYSKAHVLTEQDIDIAMNAVWD